MTRIYFTSISTEQASAYWAGGLDAHQMAPEVHVSDGTGLPCRHCQQDIEEGARYMILAYRPFESPQPYAEVGPIFLHSEPCPRYKESDITPPMFLKRESYLLKAYNQEDRIIYGTGKIVKPQDMVNYAETLLDDPGVAYIHARSSLNNCYTCRIDRAS